MKYLLIINNDTDGVGQPALNLCSNLIKKGHQAKVVALHKKSNDKNVIKLKRSFVSRLGLFILNFIKKDFKELFGFGFTTIKYKSIKKYIEDSDIIIIFTFYKIISNELLEKILSTKKIIYFRPLDIELATGGCHFNKKCQKFKSQCNNCPKILASNLIDLPTKNLISKKKIFEKFKPRIFVQNNYVGKIFKSSNIFKNVQTYPVFIGTNTKRNKFYSKKVARQILKLDKNEKIILFGAFDLSSEIKGGHLLIRALNILDKIVAKNSSDKIRLITIGKKNNFNLNTKKILWSHFGIISDNKKLNLIYRSADVLVCPSLYCFGPHIVTEALLNDLPVVGFDLGVAQDTVINGVNGYLVPKYNNEIFAKSIYKTLFNKKNIKTNQKINKIKSFCSSEYETETIINYSQKDLVRKSI